MEVWPRDESLRAGVGRTGDFGFSVVTLGLMGVSLSLPDSGEGCDLVRFELKDIVFWDDLAIAPEEARGLRVAGMVAVSLGVLMWLLGCIGAE